MEYRKFNNTILVRMDKGEEILEKLKELAIKENIKLASINAIGATNDFTVGARNSEDKQYHFNTFKGDFEIISLVGTITTMNGEYFLHFHMSAGNEKGEVFGGHLSRAVISATCEMAVNVLDGEVDRKPDDEIGINLLKF